MIILVVYMFTIESDVSAMSEVKKSKFIAIIKKIDNELEVKDILNNIKKEYIGAKHYTYAYIIGNIKKVSDDKEPSGTAGMPILNVLEKKQLTNIICVVVRYFGGVLLGAPGLVRAYSNSVITCLENADIIPLIEYEIYNITFSYYLEKEINYLLKGFLILEKNFDENIKYKIKVPKKSVDLLEKLHNFAIEIKKSD